MNQKNILLGIVLVVALLVVGQFFFFNKENNLIENNTNNENSTSTVQGKLDINVICEGALAYMTFPDGASADRFVAECKEGKHPEVIERYKSDMNLGDGATI